MFHDPDDTFPSRGIEEGGWNYHLGSDPDEDTWP